MRLKDNQQGQAMFCDSGYGPTFGGGHDLHIATNANTSDASYHNIGHTYALPPGAGDNTFLTGGGNNKFRVSEYEVWALR
jgi:hypothetical protein